MNFTRLSANASTLPKDFRLVKSGPTEVITTVTEDESAASSG